MERSEATQVKKRLQLARIERNWHQRDLAEQLGTTVLTINRWERGHQQPGPYFRAKLCALFGKSAEELGLVGEKPPLPSTTQPGTSEAVPVKSEERLALWTIPSPRNPYFTGRDDLLERLALRLSLSGSEGPTSTRHVALTQPSAIRGLGGIGKTQLAVEYAYRAREQERYTHTLWIHAANEETILSSFAGLVPQIPSLAAQEEKDQRKLVAAVIRWLERCPHPWLMIFDNADDLSLVQPYLPHRGYGSLLLTTRAHAVGALALSLDVEPLGVMEGTHFLLQRTQRLAATDEESNEAANVVMALDGFPLALDQAGAYIEETGCSFGDYLHLYHEHRHALLARRGTQATRYPDSVATTWWLSFQQIEQANPAAADLLRLCAFLAPDHIPEELLRNGAPHWPPKLQEAVADLLSFNRMLEDLLKFSLIKRLVEEQMLSIHRLVQVIQTEQMDPDEQEYWARCVVSGINEVFPPHPREEMATWPQCQRYLEQVQTCDVLIQQYRFEFSEAADVLQRAGIYLCKHALYALAEPLYQRALRIWEQQLGPDHSNVASTLNDLGTLYFYQGKYAEAEPLFQRALRIWEQQLGPDHSNVTSALNGLANLYKEQGKYALAESLYQRALRIREQQFGPDHPEVATLLNHLALLHREQGRYTEAEPLYQRALRISEQRLEPDHPNITFLLNNLAFFYVEQGRYAEAEPLYQRALRIREQQLGPDHSEVAYPLNNLATLYNELGNYAEAEPLFQRALRIWEQQLGPDHPNVSYPLNNLALLYREQGKYALAEPIFLRAIRIREQQLGPDNPKVASPLNNLGELYTEQGKYAEAESLYQRALRICEQTLGSQHLQVAEILSNLGELYTEQDNYAEAEPFYQRALRIYEQTLGSQHLQVAEVLNGLANLSRKQGRSQLAESLYLRSLTIREQVLGTEHLFTAASLNNLGEFYCERGKDEQAEPLLRRALSIREQTLGADHPQTAQTLWWLATLFQQRQDDQQAESLYQRALSIFEHTLGSSYPRTQKLRTQYASLLRDRGREAEAVALERKPEPSSDASL